MLIKKNLDEALLILQTFVEDSKQMQNIAFAGDLMVEAIKRKGKIISCGNGGSMCDAMHFAEELTGKFKEDRKALPAISISDPSYLSCVGNDYGYDAVFSRYIQALGNKEDILLAISTSGNSVNVIEASIAAQKKGMRVVSLTGKTGGKLKEYSDICIQVPWDGYADRIQEIHIKVIHSLIEYIEQKI